MPSQNIYRYQTIAETFAQICKGEQPWIAIGNFLNDWWYYSVAYRSDLIRTPLVAAPDEQTHQWAVFCVAMVEWLCEEDDIPCPDWTRQERYILAKPWFLSEKWTSRALQLATTPAPFKKRNIFGGSRMLVRK